MAVDRKLLKDFFPQIVATILGTLMAVSDGMTYGWTSPMVPYFMSNATHLTMTPSEADWLETVNLLGYAAGLPFTILSVDRLGRKLSMALSAALGCLCWLLLFVVDVRAIFVSRFFAGMAGDMCFVAAPMYIAEISDYRIRGFLSSVIYVMMVVGVVVVYCTGALAPYWVTPTVGAALAACQAVSVLFLPESPYYYLYKGDWERGRRALGRLRGAHTNVDPELAEIAKEVERERAEKSRPQDLMLIKSNRLALCICLILNGGQHFVGISVFLMNLQVILEAAGSVYIAPTTASIIFAAIMLVSTLMAAAIIDRCGRRFLLVLSSSCTGAALFVMSLFFHLQHLGLAVGGVSWIPAACVMVYAATFKLGLGLVPIVVIAEIFPTTIKAIGMTIADVIYVVAAVASINLYQALFDRCGLHVPLYIFAAFSFAMVAFTVLWIPETKGRTLDDIQLMLKGRPVQSRKGGKLGGPA